MKYKLLLITLLLFSCRVKEVKTYEQHDFQIVKIIIGEKINRHEVLVCDPQTQYIYNIHCNDWVGTTSYKIWLRNYELDYIIGSYEVGDIITLESSWVDSSSRDGYSYPTASKLIMRSGDEYK